MPHTILYVEDHQLVADAVTETLEAEGWRVVLCVDGALALSKLASTAPYDLLLTDNHLPHINGLELVNYVRRLPHRATLPIVMFAGADCSDVAYRCGVNVFLRKPDDINWLVAIVKRLLTQAA
jgi:two-component system chemotaxis response regulator CheY